MSQWTATQRGDTITYSDTLTVEQCCNCAMWFAMPDDFERRRRDDHKSFEARCGACRTGDHERCFRSDVLGRVDRCCCGIAHGTTDRGLDAAAGFGGGEQ